MPERHADLFEVGFDQVGQDVRVDLMLAEQGFVLSEVDRVQPLGDVHRRSRTVRLHDGPRETASSGGERWPAAKGSISACSPRRSGNVCYLSAQRTDGVGVKRTFRLRRSQFGDNSLS